MYYERPSYDEPANDDGKESVKNWILNFWEDALERLMLFSVEEKLSEEGPEKTPDPGCEYLCRA